MSECLLSGEEWSGRENEKRERRKKKREVRASGEEQNKTKRSRDKVYQGPRRKGRVRVRGGLVRRVMEMVNKCK